MERILNIATSDWGTPIEQGTRKAAAFCVLIYTAGYMLGEWLHRTNDQLASWWVARLGLSQAAEAPEPAVIQTDAPEAPMRRISYEEALTGLTVKQLRAMACELGYGRSFYRTARKSELVAELDTQGTVLELAADVVLDHCLTARYI